LQDDGGLPPEDGMERLAVDGENQDRRLGDHRGGSRPAVEQRDLAEVVPGHQSVDRAPPPSNLGLPAEDHVELVAGVALLGYRRALVVAPLPADRRDVSEITL